MKRFPEATGLKRQIPALSGAAWSRFGWKGFLSSMGLLFAALIALLPWEWLGAPLLVLFIAGGVAFALVLTDSRSEDRPFAARLFFIALGVYLIAIFAFWGLANGRQTYWLDDARAYDRVGWAWAQAWHAGESMPLGLGNLAWVSADKYPQWVGIVYFLIGHAPAALLVFQAVLGAASVYITYRIASQILGSLTARLAGWLMIGYTGFLLFSIMILKDSLVLFLILICFLAWVRILEKINQPFPLIGKIGSLTFWILIAVAAIVGVNSLRDYTAHIIIGALALGACHLLVRLSGRWRWAMLAGLILAGALLIWWQSPGILGKRLPPVAIAPGSTLLTVVEPPATETVKALLHWIRTRPTSFGIFMFSASAATLIAPFAWIFPGTVSGAPAWSSYLVAYPGMWLWYLCIPFAIIGVFSSLRRSHGDVLPVLFFAIAMFLLCALLLPRESRHRDMMMPFALMLAAEGIIHGRRWTALGLLIWLPLAGFMAWKLDALLPVSLLVGLTGMALLVLLARRQRMTRLKRIQPNP